MPTKCFLRVLILHFLLQIKVPTVSRLGVIIINNLNETAGAVSRNKYLLWIAKTFCGCGQRFFAIFFFFLFKYPIACSSRCPLTCKSHCLHLPIFVVLAMRFPLCYNMTRIFCISNNHFGQIIGFIIFNNLARAVPVSFVFV